MKYTKKSDREHQQLSISEFYKTIQDAMFLARARRFRKFIGDIPTF